MLQTLGNTQDAIGINAKVTARLSGADFDGDTVAVIPTRNTGIKNSPALDGLKILILEDILFPMINGIIQ